ncbi:hypothetical protein [Mycolicibacterium goodii]|uniref:hypothetical protein n=1 Tax=Mycolicibacterium goodii TaxID=134601 RepID=UPI00093CFEB4|nr:hypothetical protein [Mycolicibacterium goodii]MBU8841246.1 hypothetical protein [Mycolicibacterium goodii]OKH68304.1 hypothetical protein EB74_33565 [Mycobacterium sp. SWH-M5]
MTANANHRNLADKFGSAPPRGAGLQGLLSVPAARAAAGDAEPQADPEKVAAEVSAAAGSELPSQAAAEFDLRAAATATTTQKPPRARRKNAETGRGPSAASVYLTAETYKQLTLTKSRKIKDYAQIVQDAFAQVAREAADQKKSPDEVLAGLFQVEEHNDDWMMPSSTSRSKSATPLTEARISLSAQQRAWIEEKMAVVGRPVTFSEFLARVLDHHLLPAKRR